MRIEPTGPIEGQPVVVGSPGSTLPMAVDSTGQATPLGASIEGVLVDGPATALLADILAELQKLNRQATHVTGETE